MSFFLERIKDVDGRDKPGHDEGNSIPSFRDAPAWAQNRNPEVVRYFWIPGSCGACHRAALCADPLARPGMTIINS
jgi:hypothetical protein